MTQRKSLSQDRYLMVNQIMRKTLPKMMSSMVKRSEFGSAEEVEVEETDEEVVETEE